MGTEQNRRTPQPLKSRAQHATDRVLAAAARILRRDGYARLTMEGVALDSGAAKTTVYRRWATKAALCMDLYWRWRRESCTIPTPATSPTI